MTVGDGGWVRQADGRHVRRGTVVIGLLLLTLIARVPGAVPMAIPLAVAWWLAARERPPRGEIAARLDAVGLMEGDQAVLCLRGEGLEGRVDATVVVSHHLTRAPRTVTLTPRSPTARVALTATTWGPATVGPVVVRVVTAAGTRWTTSAPVRSPGVTGGDGQVALPIHPHIEPMPTTPSAQRTMPTPGVHTARSAGRGIEFADLRPHAPGDPARDVNWRVSARRGELWVTQRHPEQRQDVVLLLDTFEGAVLPDAVRLCYALASDYLSRRDRVGVVGFGGILRWLEPGGGLRHQTRVEAALMASQAAVSAAWRDLQIVPPKTLPQHALVVAVTPLREARTLAALQNLLARRRDLTVIDVAERVSERPDDSLVLRLDALRRDTRSQWLRQRGARVVAWHADESAAAVTQRAAARTRARA